VTADCSRSISRFRSDDP